MAMEENGIDFLKTCAKELPEPEDLFQGMRLPAHFELPDDILLFYHDFCAPAPNAHCRYTLVFPLAAMHYFVDEEEYDLAEGDLLLIRPYALRFLSPRSAGYQRFFITFRLNEPQSYLPENCLNRLSPAASACLKEMVARYDAGDASGLSLALYGFLTHLSPGPRSKAERGLSPAIARSVSFINENFHRDLDVGALAARVNMSVSNFARKFRRETGGSVHACIAGQRLEFARYYLCRTRMSMDEIARRCGFQSGSSFSHFFKTRTGLSPLTFRKQRERTPGEGAKLPEQGVNKE